VRVDLVRRVSTSTTTTSSGGSTTRTSSAYYSDASNYDTLGVDLGNGIHVDIAGNIFFDIPRLAGFADKPSYSLFFKKAAFEKKGNAARAEDGNVFTPERNYEIADDGVYEMTKSGKRLSIKKTPDGFERYTYAINGKVSNTDSIVALDANHVATADTAIYRLDVERINEKAVVINASFMLGKNTVLLEIVGDNALRYTRETPFFGPKVYTFTFGKSMVTCANEKGGFVSQISIVGDMLMIVRKLDDASLGMKMFGSDVVRRDMTFRY
jgi:hypothetical protein